MTHYLAFSTGPILDTIMLARKTRELWLSSYLLSHLMRRLTDQFDYFNGAKHINIQLPKATILAPLAPSKRSSRNLYGAGIYPDRLYVEVSEALDRRTIATVKKLAIEDAAADLLVPPPAKHRGDDTRWKVDTISYFEDYFRIAHVQLSEAEVKDGILTSLNQVLETMDLQPAYLAMPPIPNPLTTLLNVPYTAPLTKTGLVTHSDSAYVNLVNPSGKTLPFEFFPSTADVASHELYRVSPEAYRSLRGTIAVGSAAQEADDERNSAESLEMFYSQLEGGEAQASLNDVFQDYHKYFCIVHADGDGFGALIQSFSRTTEGNRVDNATEKQAITTFSQKLADFAGDAAGLINRYGGKPIYVGGDDLFFLSPVVSWIDERRVTVFDLITALDDKFKQADFGEGPTLSYGLTITYYKFPLFEARDLCYKQLTAKAKKAEWSSGAKKNTVSIRFQRHSGSYFEAHAHKDLFAYFVQLSGRLEALDDEFLSSFIFKLRELEDLVLQVQTVPAGGDNKAVPNLKNLVANFFNEPIHRAHQSTLLEVADFVERVYAATGTIDGKPIPTSDNLYALLRLLAFVAAKSSNHEEE